MVTVYKYPIPIEDEFTLDLPIHSQILKVECQHGRPCMWALVCPTHPTETRRFRLAGTGHPITQDPDRMTHLATFQMAQGALVWHVFEVCP
jgi:hypothetical protein